MNEEIQKKLGLKAVKIAALEQSPAYVEYMKVKELLDSGKMIANVVNMEKMQYNHMLKKAKEQEAMEVDYQGPSNVPQIPQVPQVQDVQDVQDVMEYPADNPDKQVQQPQKQQQNIAPVRTCQPQFEQPRVRPAVKDNSVRMPSEQQAPREKTAEEKSAETFNFDSAEMGMDEVPGMPDFSDDANDGQQ